MKLDHPSGADHASAGEAALQKIDGDPITAYTSLMRAKEICDESADRILTKDVPAGLDDGDRDQLRGLRADCYSAHRTLARAYGKIANLVDEGGGPSKVVEARDMLDSGQATNYACHTALAEKVRSLGGDAVGPDTGASS